MSSERLPGKVLRMLDGRVVLSHVISRLRRSTSLDAIVVATSDSESDDPIAEHCSAESVAAVRGSLSDVLSRFRLAAAASEASAIVRITADCPLVEPSLVDSVVREFVSAGHSLDYLSNTVERSFPRGMDVEVFSAEALERADTLSSDPGWREHVTPALYRLRHFFRSRQFCRADPNRSRDWRLTLDTPDDLVALEQLATHFRGRLVTARLHEIEAVLLSHPEILELNSHVAQKHH